MKKTKEKIKDILKSISIITSAMALTSLWITHTDNWKWHLPVCLACIVSVQWLSDN